MAWFNRSDVTDTTEEPSISPDTEPTMFERVRAESWFGWAVRIVAIVIIILILLFGIRALHHHFSHNNTKTVPANTKALPPAPGSPDKTSGTSSSSSSGSGKKTAGNAQTGSNSTSLKSTPAPTPTQVPNTGPGDVVAIFVASTALAAGAHYALRTNRQS